MDSGEHEGEAEVRAKKALTRTARLERLDKRPSPLVGQPIDMCWLSTCRSDCVPLISKNEVIIMMFSALGTFFRLGGCGRE
jgi:hypothetical protein